MKKTEEGGSATDEVFFWRVHREKKNSKVCVPHPGPWLVLPMDQPETSKPETSTNATFRAAAITHFGDPWQALPEGIQYIAFAEETCPTTGRKHYQTWAYASKPMRLTGWKRIFPRDHIEKMYGTFTQNDRYCSKEGQLIEFGTRPMGNGQRRDLDQLSHAVVEAGSCGKRLSSVVIEEDARATFVQFHSGITQLYRHAVTEKLRRIDKDFAPQVIYIQGKPGTGKTRYVYETEPDLFRVPDHDGYKWKDGYSGEPAVLYDNVSIKNITRPETLLQEIDRYFIQVPVKGGYIGWRPERIYITSVYDIETFAENVGFSDPQEFTRRVTLIKRL